VSTAHAPEPGDDMTRRLEAVGDLPLATHPEALEAVLVEVEGELDALRRSVPAAADGDAPGRSR
jgi:hypothetical protein